MEAVIAPSPSFASRLRGKLRYPLAQGERMSAAGSSPRAGEDMEAWRRRSLAAIGEGLLTA